MNMEMYFPVEMCIRDRDYTVRPFVEVEQEYLEMFQKLSES